MGHYCSMCRRSRPNEKFSGGGHRNHICKECNRLPKIKKLEMAARQEIRGFLTQSHISKKNLRRLREFCNLDVPQIQSLAAVVLEIAQVAPFKRKRFSLIKQRKPELCLQNPICEAL